MTSNRQFIAEAAALASANYPTWNPSAATLELWAVAMPELSGREFLDAMVSHIRNSPYQPTVSALLSRHRDLSLGAEVETPGILAWGEVHKSIRAGMAKAAPDGSGRGYWSHELTEQALHALGGWICVKDCQSSQISSMRSRFCEAFDGLAKLQEQEEERVAVAQIVGGSGPLLTDGTGGDKTTRELE